MRLPNNLGLIVFSTAVVLGLCAYGAGIWADTRVADLDGNTTYHFPVEGQDSPGYVMLGESLREGRGFTAVDGSPETFRTPGYPALIAFLPLPLIVLLQILMAAGIVVMTFRMGERLVGRAAACVAAVLVMLSPNLIFHSVIILSDTVFTFLFVLSLYLLFFTKRPTLLAGIVLGLAALVRPIALYLPVFILPFLVYQLWQSGLSKKKVLALSALCMLGFVIPVAPWYVRNGIETGTYGFSSVSTYNLAGYNIPQFLAARYGADSPQVTSYKAELGAIPSPYSFASVPALKAVVTPVLNTDLVPYIRYHILETSKFFLSSSARYVVLHVQIPAFQSFFGLTDSAPSLLDALKHGEWGTIIHTLTSQSVFTLDRLLLVILSLLALAAILIKKHRFHTLLFLGLIAYFALLTGPVSIPRYRLPVEPLLVLLAMYSLVHLYGLKKDSQSQSP